MRYDPGMTFLLGRPTPSTLLLVLPLFAASALACSDDGGSDDEVAAETMGSTSDTTTTSGTSEGSTETTGTTGTTGTTETTGDEGTGDTETTDESSTDESEDESEEDTGPEDFSQYEAVIMPGGLDRIVITRVNFNETTCTEMVLFSPVMGDDFDVEVEGTWAIELVRSWDDTTVCPDDVPPDSTAGGGMGNLDFGAFDALGTYPCTLSFDMEIYMSTEPPTSKLWISDDIPVMGVNCG